MIPTLHPPPRPRRADATSRLRTVLVWLEVLAALMALVWLADAAAQPLGDTVAPPDAPADGSMTAAGEPGEPLVVSGTVYGAAGEPLAGASVFAYQTDAEGIYGPDGNADPRLRVYLRTDERGRYRFTTIRPGSYPGTRIAAHIHFHVTPAVGGEAVSELVFEGDPYITERMRRNDFFTVRPIEDGAVTYDIRLGG